LAASAQRCRSTSHVLSSGEKRFCHEESEIEEADAGEADVVARSAEREGHVPRTPWNLAGGIVSEHEVVGMHDPPKLSAEPLALRSMLAQAVHNFPRRGGAGARRASWCPLDHSTFADGNE
jgi:hypothetical protein